MAYAVFDTPAIHPIPGIPGIPGIKELARAGSEMGTGQTEPRMLVEAGGGSGGSSSSFGNGGAGGTGSPATTTTGGKHGINRVGVSGELLSVWG